MEEEIEAVGPHLRLLAENGAKVMVYGEVADASRASRSRCTSGRASFATRSGANTATADARSRGTSAAIAACASPTTITWARTSKRRRTSIELMEVAGDEVGLLFDSGHMTFAGGDAVAMLAKHVGASATCTARTCGRT